MKLNSANDVLFRELYNTYSPSLSLSLCLMECLDFTLLCLVPVAEEWDEVELEVPFCSAIDFLLN